MGRMMRATARANIALVKYWGKSDSNTNLPAVDSLSLTLDSLVTETTIEAVQGSACVQSGDIFILDGKAGDSGESARVSAFCDLFRKSFSDQTTFVVRSRNHFPTGAGLASSASAFAALGSALAGWYGLQDQELLANLVRQGSGSAPRSLLGGFVHLHRTRDGIELHNLDSSLLDNIAMLVLIADPGRKSVSSREAMERSRNTSPYWQSWLEIQPRHLQEALQAIADHDLATLGCVADQNASAMHALCHTSWPPVHYWQPQSLQLIRAVREAKSFQGWITMDAGPQVKVILDRSELDAARKELSQAFPDIQILTALPGRGAEVEKIG